MHLLKNLRAGACLCFAITALLSSRAAFADSFDIYQLYESSGSISNTGLTDSGSLTTFSASTLKYTTFAPPSSYTTSSTLPAFSFDNGTASVLSVAGLLVQSATDRCNNGRCAFEAISSGTDAYGLYLLDNGILQLLYNGAVSGILLDANGDVAFTGLNYAINQDDTTYLYYDTSSRAAVTPEPSSILLLLTGGLGIAIVWRRRMVQGA